MQGAVVRVKRLGPLDIGDCEVRWGHASANAFIPGAKGKWEDNAPDMVQRMCLGLVLLD